MHLEVLDDKRKEMFSKLGEFSGFYLAGGTALALQLGHRISVDFDLFSPDPISKSLLQRVGQVCASNTVQPIVNNGDELTVICDDVKVTFLTFPFPPLFELVTSDSLQMLGIQDIAANKAYTIGRRGEFRDYVDVYTIIREGHCSLTEIISLAERKFGSSFTDRLFLEQLVYLDDVSDTDVVFLTEAISKDDIVSFFSEHAGDVLH